MKVTRIFHAAINVAGKLEEAKAFYTGLMGLPQVPVEIPGMIDAKDSADLPVFWIEKEGVQMHVIGIPVDGAVGGVPNGAGEGGGISPFRPHTSWLVEDIQVAVDDLNAGDREVLIAGEGRQRVVWTLDPVGNVVEFQQDPDF